MLQGAVHTIAASPTKLGESEVSMRVITIRLEPDASICYFGDSDMVDANNAFGYVTGTTASGESWTFGPFERGSGIKPSEIYIFGTAEDKLFWSGLPA